MKILTIIQMLLVAAVAANAAASTTKTTYAPKERTTAELRQRGGLPEFYKKLRGGDEVRIAYFGGSITEQSGWRVKSADYFKKRFPNAKIVPIHAAIGGTGSFLGSFRIDRDVLSKSPDLVFVEFAVNDFGLKPEQIRNTMEGVVRKIRKANPKTDICLVYTFTEKTLKTIQSGKMYTSEAVMEDVADHYAIPSINMCLEIAKLEKDGKLIMKSPDGVMTAPSGETLDAYAKMPKDAQGRIVFSKDGVHPFPNTGHVFYMDALARSFEKLEKMPYRKRTALPAPISSDNYENAKMIPANDPAISYFGDAKQPDKNSQIAKQFGKKLDAITEMKSGSKMRFKFRGTALAFYDIIGPHGCKVDVKIDGKPKTSFKTFDGYCTYARRASNVIALNLPDGEHEVELAVSPEKFDKRKILFERNRSDYDKNPEKYATYTFTPAAVMIRGEMCPQ